ncbi:MAG: LamB/YcsF family protein [Ignavibacteriales bacterium]|nr:LamB/YcsF family protein [Ignavibacteriales bacterium]
MLSIDINSDMGERPEALRDGSEELLMQHISSANIACGGHAGDVNSMEATIRLAIRYGVSVGAHPGYPDRVNFGRVELQLSSDEIESLVFNQVREFGEVCRRLSCEPRHVKPHGALYNVAVNNGEVAHAIAAGVQKWNPGVVLVGLADSEMLQVWKDSGFRVAGEAFVDRAYERDGTLRSRKKPDALITEPAKAAERAVRMVREGMAATVEGTVLRLKPATLCIHSDTPNSAQIASALREELARAGISVKALGLPV